MRTIVVAMLALGGCGGSPLGRDAAVDLVFPLDVRGAGSDLVGADGPASSDLTLPDLASSTDLSTPADLAEPADDLSVPDDLAQGFPRCPATAGYGGIVMPPKLPPCGQAGRCNGHAYALDCDGNVCTCAFDGTETTRFIQLQATCSNLNDPWANACGF